MKRITWIIVVVVPAFVAMACARDAGRPAPPSPALPEIVEIGASGAPAKAAPEASGPAVEDAGPKVTPPVDLSALWSPTARVDPRARFQDEITAARGARGRFASAAKLPPGQGADTRAAYAQGEALVQQAARGYARAAHTLDASHAQRLVSMAEAAEVMAQWMHALADGSLDVLPKAWRTDPSLDLTFEDVATGPVRRWRGEAWALARRCTSTARAEGLEREPAARRCEALERELGALSHAKANASDRDGGTACACDPLDPLCSASLGPWCTTGGPRPPSP